MPSEHQWKATNCREHHLRVGGRIVGKLAKWPADTTWTAMIKPKRGAYRVVGWRADPLKAREIVDRVIARGEATDATR